MLVGFSFSRLGPLVLPVKGTGASRSAEPAFFRLWWLRQRPDHVPVFSAWQGITCSS